MGIFIITKIPNRPICDIIILGDFNTSMKNENPYYLKIIDIYAILNMFYFRITNYQTNANFITL